MNMSASSSPASTGQLAERVRKLEDQLAVLTEAVEVLARGLESTPLAEPAGRPIEEAARRAYELLLLARSSALAQDATRASRS